MFQHFLKNFSKYAIRLLVIGAIAAAIATGVGAALGVLGIAGFAGTAAVGSSTAALTGITTLWAPVAAAMTTVGSALGFLTSIITNFGVASGTATIAAGAGAIAAGATGLVVAGAAAATVSDMQRDAEIARNYYRYNTPQIPRSVRRQMQTSSPYPQQQVFAAPQPVYYEPPVQVVAPPPPPPPPPAPAAHVSGGFAERVLNERQAQRSAEPAIQQVASTDSHADKVSARRDAEVAQTASLQ